MINYFFYKDYRFNKLIKHQAPLFVSSAMVTIIEFVNTITFWGVLNNSLFHLNFTTSIILVYLYIYIWLF